MSTIATFYSFKGGVGRSMALANVALLLAQRGARVLAVDWDLEAPGLERYFSYFEQASVRGGLLPLLTEIAGRNPGDRDVSAFRDHLWQIDVGSGERLDLLPSGRDDHASYAMLLEDFDWRRFFADGGGDFLEALRERWKQDYDVVLIDSRTGMSDSGGICTIQMPDVLVAMFTANEQSMLGVSDIIRASQRGRQALAYDRMPLTVLPVPCRFGGGSEFEQSLDWLDRFAFQFGDAFDDWLPAWMQPRQVFERLKVPQVDWFGFGERLAVYEQGVSDPTSMGFVFDRIADLLESDFQDLEGAFGTMARAPRGKKKKKLPRMTVTGGASFPVEPPSPGGKPAFDFDLYISYRGGGALGEWSGSFITTLHEWLPSKLERPVRIYFDQALAKAKEIPGEGPDAAMRDSALMLALLSPSYFTSKACLNEWAFFEDRERNNPGTRIIPVIVRGDRDTLPDIVFQRPFLDISDDIDMRGRGMHMTSRLSQHFDDLSALIAKRLAT